MISEKIYSVPKEGDIGKDVLALQIHLGLKGHKVGSLDGIFGKKTLKCVQEFQKKMGLPGSGIIGPKTLQYLELEVIAKNPLFTREAITQDFKGKKDRHIHPNIRLMLEAQLFPGGKISDCWIQKDIAKCRIEADIALSKLDIGEDGGNNRGELVGQVQGTVGAFTEGGNGDAWCLDYQQIPIAIIEDFFKKESPVPSTAHCMSLWNAAKNIQGLTTEKPTAGTLCIMQSGTSSSGHAAGVVEVMDNGKMRTNEGNTSIADMRDGDGSGIKTRDQKKNGSLIVKGFVFVYPNNVLPST